MITVNDALALVSFSQEELRIVAKIQAIVDDKIANNYSSGTSAGAPIRLDVHQDVDEKIAFATARDYECRGGWRVNVISAAPLSLQFIPMILPMQSTVAAPSSRLPALVRIEAPTNATQKRLLVRMPTRSRPQQALEVLALYRSKAGCPVTIEVVIDADDETMLDAQVLQRLAALECVVTVENNKSKIEAVNGGRVQEWDVLLLASDDMVPVADGYAVRALEAMEEHWPFLDGAVYFNDGFQKDNCCTLPVIGRRFYDQTGYVYHPSYKSLWSDAEQTELWRALGRLKYIEDVIIEHRHHAWGRATNDALYKANEGFWDADKETYEKRKATVRQHSQFGFDAPAMWLSLCICTTKARRPKLERLLDDLYTQISRDGLWGEVEIVVDGGEGTIGEKRQRLLERAKGHFVASIDDDDGVAWNYLSRILNAVRGKPGVDCVALNGIITTNGERPQVFRHSMEYEKWETVDGVHLRSINHLNPVRRSLALKVGFVAINHGEDFQFSNAVKPLLQMQVRAGEAPLYYYFYDAAKK